MSDKRPLPLAALAREPIRAGQTAPEPRLPPRGRHDMRLARTPLCRVTLTRGSRAVVREICRIDRRREQMPLPPGFIDRRRAA